MTMTLDEVALANLKVLNEEPSDETKYILMASGNVLSVIEDDNYDTIMSRFDTYTEITKPVLDFYSKKEGFHEIDGSLKIEEITRKIRQILDV